MKKIKAKAQVENQNLKLKEKGYLKTMSISIRNSQKGKINSWPKQKCLITTFFQNSWEGDTK